MMYNPTVKEWMHDLPIKKYLGGVVGEYFCYCVYCHTNFIGHKGDCRCEKCTSQDAPSFWNKP